MEITREAIRKLVDRPTGRHRVTSLYLATDGALYPRPTDYLTRLDSLLRDARHRVDGYGGAARQGVEADCETIGRWVRDDFDRHGVKGLGIFACNGDVLDVVTSAEPLRNLVRVQDHPYVVPLEALLGRTHHLGLAIVERDLARIFRYRLGRILEHVAVESAVHAKHDQGGWSQANFQRSIAMDVLHQHRSAAQVLLGYHQEDPFDELVLAGPHEEVVEFGRQLHPYLQKVAHGEARSIPLAPTAEQLLAAFQDVEQQLVSARRRDLLGRLAAGHGQAERVARGVRHVVEAANAQRVEVLFVVEGEGVPGYRSATGALALREAEAAAYGGAVEPVDDLIDEVIDRCVRDGSAIELFRDGSRLEGHPIAALLRF